MKFTFAQRPEGFDKHIDLSIRRYSDLWNDVIKISEYFIEDDTWVYDIGCSTGKLISAMVERNTWVQDVKWEGIEIEEDFFGYPGLEQLEDEFRQKEKSVYFRNADVRETMFFESTSFVTSIFTLQFMPRADRLETVKRIYKALNKGGGFVFAEKTMSPHSMIHDIRTFTYYDFKRENFDYEDIMTKEQELRHMQKPDTRDDLIQMCKDAGFEQVDSFWQNHSFTGFIAIKP